MELIITNIVALVIGMIVGAVGYYHHAKRYPDKHAGWRARARGLEDKAKAEVANLKQQAIDAASAAKAKADAAAQKIQELTNLVDAAKTVAGVKSAKTKTATKAKAPAKATKSKAATKTKSTK